MPYASLSDFLQRASADDLAEAAGQEYPDIDGAIISGVINGGDQPSAEAAVVMERLEERLNAAEATIHGLLTGRYPDLENDATPPGFLRKATLDIAAYELLGGDEECPRRRAYDETLKILRGMAEGKIDLYPANAPESEDGAMVLDSEDEVFSRRNLGGYRHGYGSL